MKKLLTMLGLLAIGGSSLVAAPVDAGIRTDLKIARTQENFKKFQQIAKPGNLELGETIGTRDYVAKDGTVYQAKFQLWQQKLCEVLMFTGEDGVTKYYTFDQLPYYLVRYTLNVIPKGGVSPESIIIFDMEWPSEYIYSQVFDWAGERDENNQIPIPMREYEPASFDALWNNDDRCRLFRENEAAGVGGSPSNGKWDYYSMLPNELLGQVCLYKGAAAFTQLTETTWSQVTLNQFDSDDLYMDFANNIRIEQNGSKIMRVNYQGTGEVQGFVAQTVDLPEWGDLHLFNAGQISSDILGDNNPFPTDFPEFTLMYFAIGDKEMFEWQLAPDATKFDKAAFSIKPLDVEGDAYVRDHLNGIMGFTFVDKKYKDITLNPVDDDFVLTMGEAEDVDLGEDMWYWSFTPTLQTIVPPYIQDMNGNDEPWSEKYGTYFSYHNISEPTVNNPVNIGWGYKQGFLMSYQNNYIQTYNAQSTGKLYYHYDPNNMQVYRELELVGGKDAVESVAADSAKISAANGVITVVAADNANVAVYGLDGVCLKNVKAAAGEAVNVEAAKGIYVVTVNGASKKVAL